MIAQLLCALLLAQAGSAPAEKAKSKKAKKADDDGLTPPPLDLTPPSVPPSAPPPPEPKPAPARPSEPKAQPKPEVKATPALTPPVVPPAPAPSRPVPAPVQPPQVRTAPPPAPARVTPAPPQPQPITEAPAAAVEADESENADAYTPPSPAALTSGLKVNGYVDVGWARAAGDGTSFPVNDTRFPADYGVDPFATAVNSRGDVASTNSNGRFTNGFLPRSANIGGVGSFLVNTADVDLRYQPGSAPLLVFVRAQLVPRLSTLSETRAVLEQAFVRLSPFSNAELSLFAGRFDSVFGIEYNENEANLRTNITPSLTARYTTGQSTGLKLFYRRQIQLISGAISANLAGTNSGTFVDSIDAPEASLTGVPVLSGRVGIEFNFPALEIKLGVSGLSGPRNDQYQANIRQKQWGADARVVLFGLALAGEFVRVGQDPGAWDKQTGLGAQTSASQFDVKGGWATASYSFATPLHFLHKITPYFRYGRRHAQFEGYTAITVDRLTAGLRLELFESLLVKGEVLLNRELVGAPQVDNNVVTTSVVYSW